MKTPAFWDRPTALSTALLPLSVLYDMAATLRRAFTKPSVLPVPVICIGNLTAGGAGKTPVAIAIGAKLKERNIGAFFLSRGYGGTAQGPMLVDPARHTAREAGDEPLLLAQTLPTVVAKDRLAGARFAIAQGAQAIVMDDGLQNPSIHKTLALAVIDGAHGFGNGRLIPAGPLRELPASGLRRAHAAIILNPTNESPALPATAQLFAKTQPVDDAKALKGERVIAFCGIARPQKFFDTLQGLGARVEEQIAFADHHPYSEGDIKKLLKRATALNCGLATTAKDAVRLPEAIRSRVNVVDIHVAFDNPALLDSLLDAALIKKV